MQKILITLPVYNESKILRESVETVHAWATRRLENFDWEIVIADNGSIDDTAVRGEALAKEWPQISVFHTDEKGRGQVLRKLWTQRDADFYTYMDADLSTSLGSFEKIIRELTAGTPMVIGSRLHADAKTTRSWLRERISRTYNWLVSRIVPLGVRDTQCGAKGINREVAERVVSKTKDDGWFFDTELIAFARQANLQVKEVPVEWVETRFRGRKSKVKLISTALKDLRNLWRLRRRLSRGD